ETAEGNPVSTADALLPEVEQIVTNHRDPAVDLIADRTLALADQSTQYQARFEGLMDKVLAAVHQGPGAREVERLDRIHAVVTAGPDPKERERLAEIHAAVTAGPNPEEAKRLADIHAAVTAPPDPGPQRLLQEIRAGVLAGTETEAGLQHRLAEVDSRLQELVKRDPQPVLQKILAEARTSSRVAADAGATHRLLQEIQAALADQREATVARKETEKVLGQILAELRSGRKEAPATPEPKRVVVQAKAKAKPTVQILHRRRDRVVFLVDASESVADDFPLVLDELDHLLATLQSGQEFNILFCRGSEVVVSPPRGLKDVGSGDRGRIMAWARGGMDGTRPGGRFNPANALRLAMQDRPQRIWLLSNAFGGAGQAAERRRLTRLFELAHAQSGIRVDAIQLFASDRYDTLRTISESSGGTYTFVVHPGGPREVEASRAD
ncbi:MAG: VWA domain-containing protein, partial [Phycisphaerae bacterium]|nr:VWA domain-containing protein [Phycisphaerae bacterium]